MDLASPAVSGTSVYANGLIVKTSTVKPVKLATLVSWPFVTAGHASTKPKNFYDTIHGRHLATCAPWISATISHLALCFICKFGLLFVGQPKWLWNSCVILRTGWIPRWLHDYFLSDQLPYFLCQGWTRDWNFLVAIDPLV